MNERTGEIPILTYPKEHVPEPGGGTLKSDVQDVLLGNAALPYRRGVKHMPPIIEL